MKRNIIAVIAFIVSLCGCLVFRNNKIEWTEDYEYCLGVYDNFIHDECSNVVIEQ